jgi:hypothetical protein
MKRRSMVLLALLPWISSCSGSDAADRRDSRSRFNAIGVVLVIDAVPNVEMEGVVFYDEAGRKFYGKSTLSRRNRDILAIGGARIPITARVVWREDAKPIWGKTGGTDYEGRIVGEYTIPIADRIPDDVLEDIRRRGGNLRLKFRLKPDGVMFGWDIERDGTGTGYVSKFDMPGGDFKEARIYNGKPVEPGWYVGPDGRRVEVDY